MNNKKYILIVDDDIAHRTMLRILLEWEYEIAEADCGALAIEKVQRTPFDLVLMDVCMPEIGGIEALDKIKACRPKIPVIMMTAYASNETVAHALEKGAYGYLAKPFDFENLRQAIENAVRNSNINRAAAS
jgi:two-component system response regulator HydG